MEREILPCRPKIVTERVTNSYSIRRYKKTQSAPACCRSTLRTAAVRGSWIRAGRGSETDALWDSFPFQEKNQTPCQLEAAAQYGTPFTL